MPHRKEEEETWHAFETLLPEERRAKKRTRVLFAIIVTLMLLTMLFILTVQKTDPETNAKFFHGKGVIGFVIRNWDR